MLELAGTKKRVSISWTRDGHTAERESRTTKRGRQSAWWEGAARGGPGEAQNVTRSGGPSLKNRETIS